MTTSAQELKQRTVGAAGAHRELIVGISRALHADPETAFGEHRAATLLTGALADLGMTVSSGAGGLPTAFTATTGTGALHVAIVAEYDALAGLGHACGHNVIAAAAVGAAAALVPLADELGLTLTVVGAPAEEGGGGKVMLLEARVFDDVNIAMMVHPGPADCAYARPLAVAHLDVTYRGRETHAAAYPALGINAADAFTVAQVAIGLLRQQLPSTVRVHGIVREAGTAPNAIPGSALGSWYVRAATLEELEAVYPRVMACFEAGAVATGCSVELEETSPRYSEFRNDEGLVAAFARNAAARGRDMDLDEKRPGGMNTASTDMGNVSRVVRAIHPYLSIDSLPAVNHQKAFADAAGSPAAEETAVEGAILMAQTVIDAAWHHDSPLPSPEQEHTHAHTR